MNLLIFRSLALAALLTAALTKFPGDGSTSMYGSGSSKGYTLPAPYPYLSSWTPTTNNNAVNRGANYTGSVALFADYGRTTTLSQTNGAAFNLVSMDLANLAPQSYVVSDNRPITFTGTLLVGGTVTQSYAIPRDDALHTMTFSGFSGLRSVSWDQSNYSNGEFQFDNILVNPVPEPASLAALGLGTVTLLRRRRRQGRTP